MGALGSSKTKTGPNILEAGEQSGVAGSRREAGWEKPSQGLGLDVATKEGSEAGVFVFVPRDGLIALGILAFKLRRQEAH